MDTKNILGYIKNSILTYRNWLPQKNKLLFALLIIVGLAIMIPCGSKLISSIFHLHCPNQVQYTQAVHKLILEYGLPALAGGLLPSIRILGYVKVSRVPPHLGELNHN